MDVTPAGFELNIARADITIRAEQCSSSEPAETDVVPGALGATAETEICRATAAPIHLGGHGPGNSQVRNWYGLASRDETVVGTGGRGRGHHLIQPHYEKKLAQQPGIHYPSEGRSSGSVVQATEQFYIGDSSCSQAPADAAHVIDAMGQELQSSNVQLAPTSFQAPPEMQPATTGSQDATPAIMDDGWILTRATYDFDADATPDLTILSGKDKYLSFAYGELLKLDPNPREGSEGWHFGVKVQDGEEGWIPPAFTDFYSTS